MFLDFLNNVFIAILFFVLGLFVCQIFCTLIQFEKFLRLKIKSIEGKYKEIGRASCRERV